MNTKLFYIRLIKSITYGLFITHISHALGDPQITSWIQENSRKYARIYTDLNSEQNNASSTTWNRGQGNQPFPVYSGIQTIATSPDWIYITTTGLGGHVMGPWFLDEAKTQNFPSFPSNINTTLRIPRNPSPATSAQLTGLGAIGCFVDGVSMFDNRDSFSYSTANGADAEPGTTFRGDGVWNRDAYVNEGVTFDAAFAHQAGNQYHYHANPPALRHSLGDHVDYDASTNSYHERTGQPSHSPILGWVNDGYPLYGPYGFSDPNDPDSPVSRMRSGFQKRDGTNGTDNLNNTGRRTLPAWAAQAQGINSALDANSYGPTTSNIPLGHYLEDYDYLGALGRVKGTDFDLDQHNGRFCITPEFPHGTYAYFVSIEEDGTPKFPYNIGRTFYGTPAGGTVQGNIPEDSSIVFEGGANAEILIENIKSTSDTVTLNWTSIEGGTYRVETSVDFDTWSTTENNFLSEGIVTEASMQKSGTNFEFLRIILTDTEAQDNAINDEENNTDGPVNNTDIGVTPMKAVSGSSLNITLSMNANVTPPLPPAHVNPSSITVGNLSAQFLERNNNEIAVRLEIPEIFSAGAQDITITFPGPNGQMGPTYTAESAFVVEDSDIDNSATN